MLMPSGELERRTGRPLNDGIFENMVRVHHPTKLELKSGKPAIFYAEAKPDSLDMIRVNDVASDSVEFTFTETGRHVVRAITTEDDGSTKTHSFRVMSKVIRVELRDLSSEDREIYFNALHTFQNTRQVFNLNLKLE